MIREDFLWGMLNVGGEVMDKGEHKEKCIAEIDQLYESVMRFDTQRDFLEYMGELRKFPYLAPYNAMMVKVQKP